MIVVDHLVAGQEEAHRDGQQQHHGGAAEELRFQAALELAGAPPRSCAIIGNSEEADIAPAAVLGLRTILVAIEEPPPAGTIADATATSLREALRILRSWVLQ